MAERTVIVDIRGAKNENGLLEMDRRTAYRICLSLLTALAMDEHRATIEVDETEADRLPPMR